MTEEIHNIIWAAKKLEEGLKIRRPHWSQGVYYYNMGYIEVFPHWVRDYPVFDTEDLLANDWELYNDI